MKPVKMIEGVLSVEYIFVDDECRPSSLGVGTDPNLANGAILTEEIVEILSLSLIVQVFDE